ncbi:Stf0 family sulfotransferase [Rhabdothermincola salaria]|uniref:Stf0 family sulfotransferase n=1 Tax=Rhabdothermincola salaria TaxID=2903142 RepID=UPI001E5AA770|nr:Stf0 family sulfotransferase [Rhabdothermincola salaria]MCD9623238.1 hypothetical protein [Rhabdothermincola salaria]
MPEAPRPLERVVLVAATNRSGSTLLCRALAATGRLGAPAEPLTFRNLRENRSGLGPVHVKPRARVGQLRRRLAGRPDWRDLGQSAFTSRTARRVLDGVADRHTSDDGVLALKVMWSDYSELFGSHGFDAGYWERPVSWVRIRRDDRLGQALSWSRAISTDQWTAAMASRSEPTYDRSQIERCLERIEHEETGWDGYFADHAIEPLTVTYEDLDADYEGTVRTVFDHLGAADAPLPPRLLERQADDLTAQWRARYLAESGGNAPVA